MYNFIRIYPIIQLDIYIFFLLVYIHIYIYIYILYAYIYCNILDIHWSHWFHIHKIVSFCFYLIIISSRTSPTNCKHDPSYQWRSQTNLVKAFYVYHVEFLTSFKYSSFQAATEGALKKAVLKNFGIFKGKIFPWNLFLINFQGCKPAVLSHGNSNVGVFLWILRNFQKHLF